MVMNHESGRMLKEMIADFFKVLFHNSLEETEENHKKPSV
jgi:hypothetical protein